MARRGSSGLTRSAIPSLNTILPEPALAIAAGQNLRAGALELNQAERRESLAVRMSAGGPDGVRALVEARSVDPEFYTDIMHAQNAAIDNEAKQLGLERGQLDAFYDDHAMAAQRIVALDGTNPAGARAIMEDFREKYSDFGVDIAQNVGAFVSDGSGIALGQLDRSKLAEEGRDEERHKRDMALAAQYSKEKEARSEASQSRLIDQRAGLRGDPGSIEVLNDDGSSVRVNLPGGPPGGVPPGRPLSSGARSKVENKIVDNQIVIDRMNRIDAAFVPGDYTYPEKLGKWADRQRDKMGNLLGGAFELSPEEAAEFKRFQSAKRDVSAFASQVIKEFSGAAVSVQEMKRLDKWLVNFDENSPLEAETNIKGFLDDARNVQARYYQMLFQGLSPDEATKRILAGKGPTIDEMPGLIREAGRKARKAAEAEGLTGDALVASVKAQLNTIFGGPRAAVAAPTTGAETGAAFQ